MAASLKSKQIAIPIRLVLVTMDTHLNSAARRAQFKLQRAIPGLSLQIHAASEFAGNPELTQKALDDIAAGDIVLATMLFMEDHYLPVFEALKAKRDHCDAMVCAMSAGEVVKLTKIGKLDMSKPASGPMAILKKLRPKAKQRVINKQVLAPSR
jgi:magnesium chelatase subunit H